MASADKNEKVTGVCGKCGIDVGSQMIMENSCFNCGNELWNPLNIIFNKSNDNWFVEKSSSLKKLGLSDGN